MFNKKGASRITSEVLSKAGEVLLPALAFLVILFIVIAAGSERGAQAYYQAVELANSIDALATFDGFALLKIAPIMPDFTLAIDDDQLSIRIVDDETPKSRAMHIPQGLSFQENTAAYGDKVLGQVRIARLQDGITLEAMGGSNLQRQTRDKPSFHACEAYRSSVGSVFFDASIERTSAPASDTIQDMRTLLQQQIELTRERQSAGMDFTLLYKESSANTITIFTNEKPAAKAIACRMANTLLTLERTQSRSSASADNLEAVVLVPAQYNPYLQQMTERPHVYLVISYTQQSVAASDEGRYNSLIAQAMKQAYAEVNS